ncbi:MAG: 3-keto-disaccharide hydrolase [Pirellulaceae bacterium]
MNPARAWCRLVCLCVLVVVLNANIANHARAQEGLLTRPTSGGTVVGYQDTPLMPWTGNKFHVHDPDRPLPPVVLPGRIGSELPAAPPPSDAVVLFDGQGLEHWTTSSWKIQDGVLTAGHESLTSKDAFGDCQLHVEFMTPTTPPDNFMNRGNSGVLLMGKYEIQIFDSWHEHSQQIYADGQAAAIYGQTPPLVNACLPPGEWQSFDIVFTAPVFGKANLLKPALLTMFHNGVLVHLQQPILGEMAHRQIIPCSPHPAKLPLVLQGHGSPLQFRNVWLRPLDGLAHEEIQDASK